MNQQRHIRVLWITSCKMDDCAKFNLAHYLWKDEGRNILSAECGTKEGGRRNEKRKGKKGSDFVFGISHGSVLRVLQTVCSAPEVISLSCFIIEKKVSISFFLTRYKD